MPANKKKKKPAANPARGFATTSVASKPREEVSDPEANSTNLTSTRDKPQKTPSEITTETALSSKTTQGTDSQTTQLTAEEFERQLEESELQILVEKHAEKSKRDANRQVSRLDTDKRLLRGGADSVNSLKWLPPDLMEQTLDLIKAESRFTSSNTFSDTSGTGKMPSEEDLIYRLWTLQQTLAAASFPPDRIEAAIKYVLDIAPNVSNSVRDSIWGLEESLDWLARECGVEDLPPYENTRKPLSRDALTDSPLPTRPTTPKLEDQTNGHKGKQQSRVNKGSSSNRLTVTYDEEIEPDDLIPAYIDARTKLLESERAETVGSANSVTQQTASDLELAKLRAKVLKIEGDPLFDKFVAEQQWRSKRIAVEKAIAAEKKRISEEQSKSATPYVAEQPDSLSGDVGDEASRIAAEVLAEGDDDDDGIEGLFASLPQTEVDPETGESRTVLNSSDGSKVFIQDFGKWTGVSPQRALEEACRSRDSSVRISYKLVSETTYANRHFVAIVWTKPQELPQVFPDAPVEVAAEATYFTFTMLKVATPTATQSEAYVATAALFYIFNGNGREEKVNLRLPPAWRDLWVEFALAKKNHLDARGRDQVRALRALVRERRDQELEDGVIIQGAFRGRGAGKNLQSQGQDSSTESSKMKPETGAIFKNIWAEKSKTGKFQDMLKFRMQLPMWGFKQQVLSAVEQNQVVIVCGETGCGKSTQVPSFLLEHELSSGKPCKIYCTEPRRISAISLARRVSEELGENRGDLGTPRSLVGYSIRLEANTSKENKLIYATTGIVMRMLESSNELQDITHLVLDEVHERSIDSDFLLIVLKRLLVRRKDLKVILMSATVDAERFSTYLGNAPVLNVPGRTFPVQVRYLEDAIELTGYQPPNTPSEAMIGLDDDDTTENEEDGGKSDMSRTLKSYSPKTRVSLAQLDEYKIEPELILQLVAHIAADPTLQLYSKAILIFLPGIAEIRTLNDMFLGDPRFMRDWLVYPLHSSIATEDQEAAFLVPPQGTRKIVLATNIAETGITIPDVTCVIDTGKHREMRFDERRQLSRLVDAFISRANAKQRRGRAGRVQEGLCFHMFTKHRHDKLMNDQQTPEMLRLSLQDLAIRVKICKLGGIEETFGDALDPPSAKNIRRAIDALIDVRALTNSEDLTPLGHQLARLPLDVFSGKLILLGAIFKCLDMALTVAAILSSKTPFSAPFGQRAQADNARALFRRADSDVLTIYNAYIAWKRVCQANSGVGKEFQFCRSNFLSQQTLSNIEDLKGQLLTSLVDSGFLSITEEERRSLNRARFSHGGHGRRQQHFFDIPRRVNLNSDNDTITASVIAWSFYPKLLVRDQPGKKALRNIGNNQTISLHPTSVNKSNYDIRWMSYYHIMQAKTVYHAHETTAVEPFAIALLCGDVRCDMYSGVIVLEGNRGRFVVPDWKTMLAIKTLRTRLRELLTRCFKQPGKLLTAQLEKWLDIWQKIFSQDFEKKDTSSIRAEVVF